MTREKERFWIHLPGNSVSDVGERMKGGAVKEDKSPENEAILIKGARRPAELRVDKVQPGETKGRFWTHDFRKEVQDPRWLAGTAYVSSRGRWRRC